MTVLAPGYNNTGGDYQTQRQLRSSSTPIATGGDKMLYDDFGSIRIVDPVNFDSSQKLREDSQLFSTSKL
jgi:hypothetical protein